MKGRIVKILQREEFLGFRDAGTFHGSADDRRDGFIHLSSTPQVAGSLSKHFSDCDGVGKDGLSLLFLDPDMLDNAIKWEKSHGGELFPHYYGALTWDQVLRSIVIEVGADGLHVLPDGME